jgi:hypothetical protein
MILVLVLLALGGVAIYEIERAQTIVDSAAAQAVHAVVATRPVVGGDTQLRFDRAQAAADSRAGTILHESLLLGQPQVTVQADFARAESGETTVAAALVAYDYSLSPISRAVLLAWLPEGVVHLKGRAYEPIPSYVSAS